MSFLFGIDTQIEFQSFIGKTWNYLTGNTRENAKQLEKDGKIDKAIAMYIKILPYQSNVDARFDCLNSIVNLAGMYEKYGIAVQYLQMCQPIDQFWIGVLYLLDGFTPLQVQEFGLYSFSLIPVLNSLAEGKLADFTSALMELEKRRGEKFNQWQGSMLLRLKFKFFTD